MAEVVRGLPRYAVYGAPMELLIQSLERIPTPLTLRELLAHGGKPGKAPTPDVLRRSAVYVQRELPIRLARRVRQFYSLPFIVGSNPWVQSVARLYASSFAQLATAPPIETPEGHARFTRVLQGLVNDHAENVPKLSRGFMECKEYMDTNQVTKFLNAALHSRIGIRIIAEQHLALAAMAEQNSEKSMQTEYKLTPTSIGIIETQMRPMNVVLASCDYVRALCEATFEIAPNVEFDGDTEATMVGVPVHLEYVMTELLKNAFRATTENYLTKKKEGNPTSEIPKVRVTFGSSKDHVSIRIRDCGGGIPPQNMNQIFSYAFTTANEQKAAETNVEPTDVASEGMQSSMGTLAGLGYGLPMARLYLNYFGGSDLDIVSLWGHGCDAFVRLSRQMGSSDVPI
ncbi:hypothetical protein MYAM1_000963 [Malassezia yamatoensis]|uniref:Protein-serine/threonine kinase n=1 Tax=Malassezia yamatoensis TaxID=253288 RepID=A0AAJ5YPM5_9BASI|nr:hypothetical protein MYAM1_000963 [Malassezia yamatoensis]